MSGVTRANDELLLGEWACLGLLYSGKAHGFALATRLRPDGDVGRVWSLSRPLVYRAIEQLLLRGLICESGEEPGIAGGNRTILSATRTGRHQVRKWLKEPVPHLRDVRSEFLLKLVLAQICGIDPLPLIRSQRASVAALPPISVDDSAGHTDVVALWRREATAAVLRFLDEAMLAAESGRSG
jgi:PadR family transcriptional regulator AphA